MLRQVYVVKDGEIIYQRNFGKALDKESFQQVYKQIEKEAQKVSTNKEEVKYNDFFKYRVSYIRVPEKNMMFIFVSDLSDKFENVKKELIRCKKEFMDMFGAILDEPLDEDTFEIFDPTIESIHKNLRPKLSLVGFSGVGKTTITRLITADDIPMEHIPTITGDIGTIKIGKLHFHLWDFAGQEQFSFLWNNFIKGSDAVLLITDSTLENVEKSKYFVELIKKEAPYAHAAVIGNKQDLPDAMPIADIERHLGMKAYSMIATDPNNRDKMIQIIADVLEMSGEVSPLLKPLIERDKKMEEAEKAIEAGDFVKAVKLFEELADLCLELGDDRVSQDFHEKAQKIKSILKAQGIDVDSEIAKQGEAAAPAPPVQDSPKAPPVAAPPPATQAPPAPPAPPTTAPPPPQPPSREQSVPPPPPVTPPTPPKAAPPTPPKEEKKEEEKPQAPPVTPPTPPTPPSPPTPPPTPQAPQAPPTPTPPSSAQSSSPQSLDKLGMLLNKLKSKTPAPTPAANVGNVPTMLKGDRPLGSQIAKPVEPTQTISTQSTSTPTPPPAPSTAPPTTPPPATSSSSPNKDQLITDLKIKIANVNKTLLDLEMQNITGDLSDEEYKQKETRLNALKEKLQKQLDDLQNL